MTCCNIRLRVSFFLIDFDKNIIKKNYKKLNLLVLLSSLFKKISVNT